MEKRKIDFVAICVSKWHLNNLIAVISLKKLSKGVLFILPQGNFNDTSRYRLTSEDIQQYKEYFTKIEFSNFNFSFKTTLDNIFFNLFKKNKTYIISPGTINLNVLGKIKLNAKPNFIVIDEGTASYVSLNEHLKISNKTTNDKNNFLNWIKTLTKSKTYVILKFLTPVSYNYLFTNNNNNYERNKRIALSLRKVYLEKEKHNKYKKSNRKKILLLIDFYTEFGKQILFEKLYKNIINELSCKYEIFIKPHPNDSLTFVKGSKYIHIIDKKIDAETLTACVHPDIIIGGISTSTYSIPAIFDITSISLLEIYLKLDGLDKDYENRFKFFKNNFAENVIYPKNINELIKLL